MTFTRNIAIQLTNWFGSHLSRPWNPFDAVVEDDVVVVDGLVDVVDRRLVEAFANDVRNPLIWIKWS